MAKSGNEKEIKLQIADIIIKLNKIERLIKDIIGYYTDSDRKFFMMEILLNNHIITLSNKIRVLKYILKEEKIEVPKEFNNSLFVIMSKRNALAHSDTVTIDTKFEGFEYEATSPTTIMAIPKFKKIEPGTYEFQNDGLSFATVNKIAADFKKHYNIVRPVLGKIASDMMNAHIDKKLK
jgi:hypothetical protein